MTMIDVSGQPDSDEDLQDAIYCINMIALKHPTAIPMLTVHCGIIRRCLMELQSRRTKDGVPVTRDAIRVILDKHEGFAETTEELFNLFSK